MRPVPKSRHLRALLLLGAAALLSAFHAGLQERTSDRQLRTAAVAVSAEDPRGFEADGLLGDGRLRAMGPPVWLWLVRQLHAAADSADVAAWFAPLSFPLTFVFLVGMYGLLWRQCLSWKAACFGALLSVVIIEPVTGLPWGAGALRSLTADGVVVAFMPLLAWVLWRQRSGPTLLWVFFATGLLAHVSFITAMVFALALAATWLARRRAGWWDLLVVVLGLLTALAAAAATPLAWWLHATPAGGSAAGSALDAVDRLRAVLAAMTLTGPIVPTAAAGMLAGLFELSTLARLLVLAIPAATVAVGFERFHVRNLRMWLGLLAVCIVGAAVFIIVGVSSGDAANRAAALLAGGNLVRLALLGLYVLFIQAVVHLSRSGLRRPLGWALSVLAVFWLVPSDNLAWPRHWVEDMAASLLPAESRPQNVQNRAARRLRAAEIEAIGRWLRLHTPRNGRIAAEYPELRILADRPLAVAEEDIRAHALLDADGGAAMRRLVTIQRDLLNPPDGRLDLERLADYAREIGAAAVIVPAWTVEADAAAAWPTDEQGGWGEMLKIYLPQEQ